MNQLLIRRFTGSAAGILVLALIVLLFQTRYAPAKDTYEVNVVFGRAGSGLTTASDVKARGVRIGVVDELSFEGGQATGVLRIDGDVVLPAPEDLTLAVTAKTLLGEKQVEIEFPEDRFDAAPFLEDGDMVVAARQPTELNEVLDTLEPFLAAIDAQELATIVDALAEQEGEAAVFAENLELTSELVSFAERTADQTLQNLEDLTTLSRGIRPTLDSSLDRVRTSLPESTRLLRENGDDIDVALVALSEFSVQLAEFLEVEEDRIDLLLDTGEPVGAMLERNSPQIGSLVDGLTAYFRVLGGAAGLLDDGTIFAPFKQFVTEDSQNFLGLPGGAP